MKQTRVVIVVDDTIVSLELREMLQDMSYVVAGEIADAGDAISLCRQLRPDLMLVDVGMPDGAAGIEAVTILSAAQIALVLLLAGFSELAQAQRAVAAGVAGCLLKPFTARQLQSAIEIALDRHGEFQLLASESNDQRELLETRRLVESAKAVLMRQQNLSEQAAFSRIQQASRISRKSMRDIANAISLAEQVKQ